MHAECVKSVLMVKPFSSGKHVIDLLTYDSLINFFKYVSKYVKPISIGK